MGKRVFHFDIDPAVDLRLVSRICTGWREASMMSESQPAFALRVVYRRCIGERERERERARAREIYRDIEKL